MPLTVSLVSVRAPVKVVAGASRPPPVEVPPVAALAVALLAVIVELVIVVPLAPLPVVWISMPPPPTTEVLPLMVLFWMDTAVPLRNKPPPVLPLVFPWTAVLVMVVLGPPSWMPPPSAAAELSRKRLFETTRAPTLFSSEKPPPEPPEKLLATVQLMSVMVPLPALLMPPPLPVTPTASAWLSLTIVPVICMGAPTNTDPTWMASM